jgi:hypothetical protein
MEVGSHSKEEKRFQLWDTRSKINGVGQDRLEIVKGRANGDCFLRPLWIIYKRRATWLLVPQRALQGVVLVRLGGLEVLR